MRRGTWTGNPAPSFTYQWFRIVGTTGIRISRDGGRTWEKPRLMVASKTYGPGPISNFVLLSDRDNGGVHALFCYDYRRVFHLHSEDDGASFSAPVEITSGLASRMPLCETIAYCTCW